MGGTNVYILLDTKIAEKWKKIFAHNHCSQTSNNCCMHSVTRFEKKKKKLFDFILCEQRRSFEGSASFLLLFRYPFILYSYPKAHPSSSSFWSWSSFPAIQPTPGAMVEYFLSNRGISALSWPIWSTVMHLCMSDRYRMLLANNAILAVRRAYPHLTSTRAALPPYLPPYLYGWINHRLKTLRRSNSVLFYFFFCIIYSRPVKILTYFYFLILSFFSQTFLFLFHRYFQLRLTLLRKFAAFVCSLNIRIIALLSFKLYHLRIDNKSRLIEPNFYACVLFYLNDWSIGS